MHPLRPDQRDLVDRCSQAFVARGRAGVMQGATGFGKTHTAAEIIRRAVARNNRVVFGAHLDTLITDTHARLHTAGIYAGFVQAGRRAEPLAPVQVASLQTLHARGERPPADLLIVDECHRAASPTVRAILEAYPHAFLLGLTATPQRGDGRPLDVFQWMECGPSVRALMGDGHLVPCDVLSPEVPTEALISEPVDAYERWLAGLRTIIFATSIDHAEWICHGLRSRGWAAATLTGETSRAEREAQRQRLRLGPADPDGLAAIVSVNAIIEGWDEPSVEGIILAREFGVTGGFLQAIGRGLRPSPATGKTRCTVVDLRGAVNLHGLPDEERVWSLSGRPRRTEKLISLARCATCAAIFRRAARCPRCGAELTAAEQRSLPRVLRREEKVALLSDLPQADRDRRYYFGLVQVAQKRMRKSPPAAHAWARAAFVKRFGRPAPGTAGAAA